MGRAAVSQGLPATLSTVSAAQSTLTRDPAPTIPSLPFCTAVPAVEGGGPDEAGDEVDYGSAPHSEEEGAEGGRGGAAGGSGGGRRRGEDGQERQGAGRDKDRERDRCGAVLGCAVLGGCCAEGGGALCTLPGRPVAPGLQHNRQRQAGLQHSVCGAALAVGCLASHHHSCRASSCSEFSANTQ